MDLDRYLNEAKETGDGFARRVQLSKATISRIRRGAQTPSLPVAVRISDATGGLVRERDLLPPGQQAA